MSLKHFNSKHIKLDEVGSTNAYLIELNKNLRQSNGTIVSASYQTEGKGQKGNVWQVQPGENLTFSVIVYPQVLPKYAFYLNVIVALAVRKTLSDLGIKSKIKWPNDILVEDRKICGVLVENQMSGVSISQSVLGIGLNVNQINFNAEIKATSIKQEGVDSSLEDVLKQVYSYLDFYYNLLLESNFELLLKHYYSHMFWYNKEGVFRDSKGEFKAVVKGITEIGMLSLVLKDGTKKTYDIKEVKFIY